MGGMSKNTEVALSNSDQQRPECLEKPWRGSEWGLEDGVVFKYMKGSLVKRDIVECMREKCDCN